MTVQCRGMELHIRVDCCFPCHLETSASIDKPIDKSVMVDGK